MAVDRWTQTTLGAIAEDGGYGLVDRPFGSNLPASAYTAFGVPVIRGSNLSLGSHRFNDSGFVFVSEETARRLSRSLCRAGDIVFTKKGTLGQTGFVPHHRYREFLLSSNQMKLTVDRKVADPLFIYYYVSSPEAREKIVRDSEITGVPKTNVTYLREFPILLPPLDLQHAIANILGTLDDKIELNRHMNETLEAVARAIFKSWFVDFDPIRAKVSGEPADSICHRLGLSPDLLPLFPSSFQDSELGETPPGWKYLPAEDVADIGIGKTPPRKEPQWFTNNPNDVPWVSIRDMGESGTFIHSTSEFLTDEAVQRFNIRIVPTHTVLLSFKLTIGRVAITDGEMVTNEAIAHFKLSSGSVLSSEFLYLYLKSFDYSRLGSTSSIAEAINSRTVKEIPILIPSDEVLRAFWNISSDLFTMIRQNQSQLKALVTTRDTLLPKLMSGELHVDGLLLHGDA